MRDTNTAAEKYSRLYRLVNLFIGMPGLLQSCRANGDDDDDGKFIYI
jgi:hypothetical protein